MAVRVTVRLNPAGFVRLANDPNGPVWRQMARIGRVTESLARALAPSRTGQLRGSIGSTVYARGTVTTARIYARARHAEWVHRGTGIYGPRRRMIRPRVAPRLVWRDEHGWHSARRVRGQRPQRFLTRAVRAVTGKTPRRRAGTT